MSSAASIAQISLEELTASIPGVVYQFLVKPDGSWHFCFVSKGIEELFEVTPEEAYRDADSMTRCIIEEDRQGHRLAVEEAVSKLQPWQHEHRIVTARTRQIKWIRGNALPRPLENGGCLWHGILTDITDYMQLKFLQQHRADQLTHDLKHQQRAREALQQQWDRLQNLLETRNRQLQETEQNLQKSQEFLDKIINTMADPLFVKDRNHRYVLINEGVCLLSGHQRHEIIGKDDFDLFPQAQAAEIWKHDSYVQQTGRGCSYELEYPGTDGSLRTLLIRKTLYTDQHGERFTVGIISDISDRVAVEQQKSRYAHYLTAAIEKERSRLARELHDVLGAALTEQSFGLRQLRRSISTDNTGLQSQLNQLHSGIRGMVSSLQRICTSLRPSLLDELGLAAAIEWLADDLTRTSGIACSVTWQESSRISSEAATELFRIVQESLTNIMKHAHADQVTISFTANHQIGVLEIRDNGCGFDPQAERSRNSFGIIGMQERATAIGAGLTLTSSPGTGTVVRLTLHWT